MKAVRACLEQGVTSGGASSPPSGSGLGTPTPVVTAEFRKRRRRPGEDEAGTSAGAEKGWETRKGGGGRYPLGPGAGTSTGGVIPKAHLRSPSEINRIRQNMKRTARGMNALSEREATSGSATTQLLRTGTETHTHRNPGMEKRGAVPEPHDNKVPVRSFLDDVDRKMSLRKVMGPKKDSNPFADEQDVASDELQMDGESFTKEEVNYRYSGKMDQACGACKYFIEPGGCKIVSGLIRPVDVCDKFDPRKKPGQGGNTVRAEFVTASEVAPPGYEHVVKALKKKPGVDNPFAVAWAMKGRRGDAEEVSPPGWEGTVQKMKGHPEIENPWALAWSMKGKGAEPRYGPRGGKKKTAVTSEAVY